MSFLSHMQAAHTTYNILILI